MLGWFGFREHFQILGEQRSPLDCFYLSLQLFTLESGSIQPPIPATLQVARFLAAALAIYAAVQALLAIFSDRLRRLRTRRFLRGHVVVCGLGQRGLELTRRFLDSGRVVVVVEHDPDNPLIESCRESGARVFVGDATDAAALVTAGVPRASHLVTVLPQDGDNAEVAMRARRLRRSARTGTLTAHVHIVDVELCDLLKERAAVDRDGFRLSLFNVLESGARMMLDEIPLRESGGPVGEHYVVVGLGKMGRSLVWQAVREWPLRRRGGEERLRLTLIDADATDKLELLRLRHPHLDDDCDLDAQPMGKNAPEFERAAFLHGPGGRPADAVFLCFDDDVHVLAAALTLQRRTAGDDIPIVMRMSEEAGLTELAARARLGDLRPVPMLEWSCDTDLVLNGERETRARALFAGRARRRPAAASGGRGDGATAAWRRLDTTQKEEWRRLAACLDERLASVRCSATPTGGLIPPFDFTAEEAEKLSRHDWSAGGAVAGPDAALDAVRAIPAALARAGYAIRREDDAGAPPTPPGR